MKNLSSRTATLLGYGGLFIWAVSAVFVTHTKNIPTFEILTITYSISFLLTAIVLTWRKEWYKVKQPLVVWLIGIFGIYGNEILYLSSFKYAPPAQADLINYLWPVFVVLFSGFLPRERLTWNHYLAVLLGFLGIYILITEGHGLTNFNAEYLLGYLLALAAATLWSVYILAVRAVKHIPTEMIGMYYGVGMIVSLIIHLGFEKVTVIPTNQQWLSLLFMGLTAQGAAYFLWDYGVKQGNFQLLSILSYGNPIISVLLLVIFHLAQPSLSLLIASILVAVSGAVGYMANQKR